MAKIIIDQFHLSFFVPHGLSEKRCDTIQATLDAARFQTTLRRAIRAVIRSYPSLAKVTFTQSR